MMTRVTTTPFKRGRWWWARVPRLGAPSRQRSLGTDDKALALEMCAFLRVLRGRRESFLLDALAEQRADVGQAYRAFQENRLDAYLSELRDGVRDEDLEPHVERWEREMERRRRPNPETRAKYMKQVRTLFVAGKPFRRSQFTRPRIRQWLQDLPVGQPNRYRAALSSFARFLVMDERLPLNPVHDVPMARENEPRTLHLSMEDVARLLDALPEAHRALNALMLCTGMESQAALAVRRRDIGDDVVYARGTKRASRQRQCFVYRRWTAIFDRHVFRYVATLNLLPDARVFAGISDDQSYRALRSAVVALGLGAYTRHDHRHTWAVLAIRDGLDMHTIARQLGHTNAAMLIKVYGRYQPTASDFATSKATSTEQHA